MQPYTELLSIITTGRPDIPIHEVKEWARLLGQLNGCKLHSVASAEKDEDEWLQQRSAGIGGSEIAGIVGDSKWTSPRQIWMNKLQMYDEESRPKKSEAAAWGNLLEPVVATEWGKRNNRQWIHIPVILVDEAKPYLMANIDGFTLTDDRQQIMGILEIKTTSVYNIEVWEQGPLPENYIDQSNWYCGITRLSNYTLVCLVGGQKLFSYDLPADPDLFKRLVDAADIFWNENVLKGVEPQACDVDLEDVRQLPKDPEEPPVVLSDAQSKLIEAYCNVNKQLADLKKLRDGLQAQIYVLLGNSMSAITSSNIIQVTESVRRTVNAAELKKTYPDIYNEFVKVSKVRTLNIK